MYPVLLLVIKNDVLLSSLGIRDFVQKLMGLNSQIYKYQNVAQQLIQTHYFMMYIFSEGNPSNLLYSTNIFFYLPYTHKVHLLKVWMHFYALGLHTPTCHILPPLTEFSAVSDQKRMNFYVLHGLSRFIVGIFI